MESGGGMKRLLFVDTESVPGDTEVRLRALTHRGGRRGDKNDTFHMPPSLGSSTSFLPHVGRVSHMHSGDDILARC